MSDPLSPEEIEEMRRALRDYGETGLSREVYYRLLDVAEDHARLHAENATLRERAKKFRALEAEAAEHVEVQLLNRTDFDPDGEIVGWRGLGLALTRALDERDKLRERVEKLEEVARSIRIYTTEHGTPRDAIETTERVIAALAACDEGEGELSKPNPGSREACNQGCCCPVLDNARGKGRWGDGDKYGWWQDEACPLHGAAARKVNQPDEELAT